MDSEHKRLPEALAEIKVRPFNKTDYKHLQELLESQDYPDRNNVTMKTLPKIGYIAMLGEYPVAIGFLRRIECDMMAMVDGVASNKHFGSVIRHKALSMIIDMLVNEAKSLKLQGVIAFTQDISIVKRAEAAGFLTLGNYSVLSLTFP